MRPPNVLLVFSDQETAHWGWPALRTPHQDRLARAGTAFRRAYCVTPQCTPARAALLTGLYPHVTGVETNIGAVHSRPLSPRWRTLGTHLRAAGYRTAYFGKWHLTALGEGRGDREAGSDAVDRGGRRIPPEYGFDESWCPPGHGQIDAPVAARAGEWLRAQRAADPDRPWCLVVSFGNPHDVYGAARRESYPVRPGIVLPPSVGDTLAGKPAAQRRFLVEDQGRPFVGAGEDRWRAYNSYYYDLIERVDGALGEVLDALDGAGGAGDTCVIYTSDHGDLRGAHGLPFKGPCLYEELVNVPLVVRWPSGAGGAGGAGAVVDALVSHLDLLPTVLELVGAPVPPELAGSSLLALTDRRREDWRGELFFGYLAKQEWACPIRGVRTARHKLSHYLETGELELYDLELDPHERENLASDSRHAEVRERLLARLAGWDAGAMGQPKETKGRTAR